MVNQIIGIKDVIIIVFCNLKCRVFKIVVILFLDAVPEEFEWFTKQKYIQILFIF
jgi:hypothetical protein